MTMWGSRAAREQAYVDYVSARYAHLRRIAFAIAGDANRGEDLLQTALTKLYVAWPRVHRDGREDAYVRQILVRADIDEHRRPWRRERPTPDLPEAVAPEPLATEDRSALFDALQMLPPMQRRAVLLRHWLGLSVRETAHELGIGEGTVKSHTSRGLEALRSVLAEDHSTP
jgi:RNA polymerase sigma-70 factor (sigma-E family)